jgi:MFS family permease
MSLLDVSIVKVALPSIERHLNASGSTVQWIVSGYALTFGLVLVPAGRLGDTLGRRRMFLVALTASCSPARCPGLRRRSACADARLLQGAAAGMLIPQNSGLIQDLFRGPERGRAFGMMGATVGVSTAAGPVIGGLILSADPGPDGWRWIFYVNVPIGLVAILLAARLIPAGSGQSSWRSVHLDVVGRAAARR